MPTVGVNPFVRRQTAESRFSHFNGLLGHVANMAREHFEKAKPGYRDGVVLVEVSARGFFSGVVEVTEETVLRASFASRRPGEDPFVSVEAIGAEKLTAEHVELVLYRRDVLLEEGPDAVNKEEDYEWELVSINARPTPEPEPMTPVAMARNFLELPGGTKAEYTAEEFARAILYWSCRAMTGEE